MTNPLPESAVELAFQKMRKYDCFFLFNDEVLRRLAGEWLEAALPAIREAVVGESAKYRVALEEILAHHANDNHRPKAFYIAAAALTATGEARPHDVAVDRAYVNGAKAGYNLGVNEDHEGLTRLVESRMAEIRVAGEARVGGPDHFDGCDRDGFIGGCERMGCHPSVYRCAEALNLAVCDAAARGAIDPDHPATDTVVDAGMALTAALKATPAQPKASEGFTFAGNRFSEIRVPDGFTVSFDRGALVVSAKASEGKAGGEDRDRLLVEALCKLQFMDEHRGLRLHVDVEKLLRHYNEGRDAASLPGVDMLSRDTGRLDHVEKNPGWLGVVSLGRKRQGWKFANPFTNYEYEVFGTAREAIDAAMTATLTAPGADDGQ